MKVEEYRTRRVAVDGWQVNLTSYRIGDTYYCTADDVSPGANLTRVRAPSREEAEEKALARATELLGRTKRHPV